MSGVLALFAPGNLVLDSLERRFCGTRFRFLLAGTLAAAEFPALPLDDDLVDAGMGGTCLGQAAIGGGSFAFGLEFFLEAAFGIRGGFVVLGIDGGERRFE